MKLLDIFAAIFISFVLYSCQSEQTPVQNISSDFKVSGPFIHENLTLFLIHGKNTISSKSFLTLQEAMEQKKVIVHETQNVNELSVENVSQEDEIYIQSGDIVKGGQQDRVFSTDMILPTKSGKVPISSFCVESGRWKQRGKEDIARFSYSNNCLNSKDLKLAAKHSCDQDKVWKKVSDEQKKLSENCGKSVQSGESASSLQLSLEDPKVKEAISNYIMKLSSVTHGKSDVIGFAFAINGKLNSADVYGSNELFKKLWPRLLEATAIEAFAEYKKDNKFDQPTFENIKSCFNDAEKGKSSNKDVTNRVTMSTQETEKNLLFETRDKEQKNAWIHRNYISK